MTAVRIALAAATGLICIATACNARPQTTHIELSADLDGDGRPDRAVMEADARTYRLWVTRAAAPGLAVLIAEGPAAQAPNMLRSTPPGVFVTTAAGPGEPETERIQTASASLIYGTEEASAALVYWTGERFRTVWLAD